MTTSDSRSDLLKQRAELAEFGVRAVQGAAFDDLLREAAETAARTMGVGYVKVLQYLPEEKEFLLRAGYGWHAGLVGHARVPAMIQSPSGYALQTGRPVIANDLENDERFTVPPLLREHKVRSAVNVVIRTGDNIFGVLEADGREAGIFTEDDVRFLQGYATVLSFAIEQARLREQNAQLARHREMLLNELHHRVRNNNQQLISLIRLQLSDVREAEARDHLEKVAQRILALTQVDEQLRPGRSPHLVDLGQHLTAVISCLFDFRKGAAAANITLETDFAHVEVSTEEAQTTGLVVNEFLTNSFKYAFTNGAGRFRAGLRRDDGIAILSLSDDGPGLPDDLRDGLGMRLIRLLARQIEGEATWSSEAGTRLEIRFPIRTAPSPEGGC